MNAYGWCLVGFGDIELVKNVEGGWYWVEVGGQTC